MTTGGGAVVTGGGTVVTGGGGVAVPPASHETNKQTNIK